MLHRGDTPCQHTLLTHPINKPDQSPDQHSRSTHPVNTPDQHTLSIHTILTPYQQTLSTPSIYPPTNSVEPSYVLMVHRVPLSNGLTSATTPLGLPWAHTLLT